MTVPDGAQDLVGWLLDRVAEAAALPRAAIDPQRPLLEYGLSSRDLVGLVGDLGRRTGRSLPPTFGYRHPTVAALAAAVTGARPVLPAGAIPAAPPPPPSPEEPIAVVGVGCRLPGGIDSPAAFWDLLDRGADAIGPRPPGRWNAPPHVLRLLPTTGGFLDDVAGFDAEFFGITPREADVMDPQQRITLEVAWAALEHAGIAPGSLRGTRTGVYMGVSASEYGLFSLADPEAVEPWSGTGAAASAVANRLSYLLDLRGPSMVVDTACSSSLVAVHHAVGALRRGETDLALVGGVNVMLTPAVTGTFARSGVLAADGRCKAFDAAADGIGRGEGCGVVVLRRLADARARGDRVLAVVRGTATNSDGRSNGMMAPNPEAQAALLAGVYPAADIDPSTVDYVEAHGTGTPLGDPIEAGALGAVLGAGRGRDRPLLVGSVKTNLGHLEGAAGVVGLIKVVLSFTHGRIPPTLHYRTPNPLIDFDALGLRVTAETTPWPRYSGSASAGVSAFGFGGSNAHVVLEEWPAAREPDPVAPRPEVFALSARTHATLRDRAADLVDWLETTDGARVPLADVAATLTARREHLPVRAAVVATGREELAEALRAVASGASSAAAVQGRVPTAAAPDTGPVFVFSGFGSHWPGMGRELLAAEPAFLAEVDRLEPLFAAAGFSLRAALRDPAAAPFTVQAPALYGMQLALAGLWRAHGVLPAAVLGHSVGEVSAAVVAGVLDAEQGLRVVTARTAVLAELDATGTGAMAALELSDAEFAALAPDHPGVGIAVHAAPRLCTVSGPAAQVARLVAHVDSGGGFARPLRVRAAAHSAAIDPALPAFRAALTGLTPRPPEIPFHSSVAGDAGTPTLGTVDYWAANLRQPVHFTRAVSAALTAGHTRFVEVAPHPVALTAVEQTAAAHNAANPRTSATGIGVLPPVLPDFAVARRTPAPPVPSTPEVAPLAPGAVPLAPAAVPVMPEAVSFTPEAASPASAAVPVAPAAVPGDTVAAHRFEAHGRAEPVLVVPTLRRGAAVAEWLRAQATLHVHGDSTALGTRYPLGPVVDLPGPAWRHRRHWVPERAPAVPAAHPLLGAHVELPDDGRHVWQAPLPVRRLPWLADHRAHGSGALPGTAFLELALAAGRTTLGPRVLVADLALTEPLTPGPHTVLTTELDRAGRLTVRSRDADGGWVTHATARVLPDTAAPPAPVAHPPGGEPFDLRAALIAAGQQRGPAFRGLTDVRATPGTATARVHLPAAAGGDDGFALHPALADACLQALVPAAAGLPGAAGHHVPDGVARTRVPGDPALGTHCVATAEVTAPGVLLGTVRLLAADGSVLVELLDVRAPTPDRAGSGGPAVERRWDPAPLPAATHRTTAPAGAAPTDPAHTPHRPTDPPTPAAEVAARIAGDPVRVAEVAARTAGEPVPAAEVVVQAAGDPIFSAARAAGDPVLVPRRRWVLVPEGDVALPGLPGLAAVLAEEDEVVEVTVAGLEREAATGVVVVAGPTARYRAPGHAEALVHTVTAIAALLARRDHPPRLWVVTTGGATVPGAEPGEPGLACLRGLVRVLAFEHPELHATLLDVDLASGAPAVAAELRAGRDDDEVAWRSGRRLRARLTTATTPSADGRPPVVRAGAYVVAGGTGELGRRLTRWLVDGGATRVVLAGRVHRPGAEPGIRDARARGVEVDVVLGDLAEPGFAATLIARAQRGGVPLRGVVHAAGVLADHPVAGLSREAIARVWRPKVLGGLRLHQATERLELDWWVAFASMSGLVGAPGQAAYATANAWLDALVEARRARGLPAVTLDWGAWARDDGSRSDRPNAAFAEVDPAHGMAALAGALAHDRSGLGVARLDVPRALSLFPALARRPYLSALTASAAPAALPAPALTRGPGSRGALVAHLVVGLARLTGADPATVDPAAPLTDLGIDSLMAARLRAAVRQDFDVALPVALLLRGASLAEVARHVGDELGLPAAAAAPGPHGVAPRDPTERWLTVVWTDALGSAPTGVHTGFYDLGGDEAAAARVHAALSARLAEVPPVTSLFARPTIAAQADLVRDELEGAPGPVTVLRAGGGSPPLALFHPAGGPTTVYQPLVAELPTSYPVLGFERLDDESTVESKAARYASLLRERQPSGPYRLGGWSFGGCLAYEVARLLTEQGERVDRLVLIDTVLPLPGADPADLVLDRFDRFAEHVERTYGVALDLPREVLAALDEDEQVDVVMDRLAAVPDLGRGALRHQYTSYVDARVGERWRPRPYAGPVLLLRATDPHPLTATLDPRYLRTDEALGWDALCPDLRVTRVPGDHLSMIDPPRVRTLARHLARALEAPVRV
ncbi:type I polyketide synthase [Actinokineospora spheciospongiae]|uniref:type I polyketide synthase n=1 Tax=Actinokineospora spheciospongiae TaxID=909613 RepID=UPI000D709D52|nr:type I polyketide synthase [Actinokineospora spheciospongiae]PWW54942.1 acyl transferase domain-containing protein [Actinokineospora spheciospongiae]